MVFISQKQFASLVLFVSLAFAKDSADEQHVNQLRGGEEVSIPTLNVILSKYGF